MKKALAAMTYDQIQKIVLEEFNQPEFRAKQLYSWVLKGVEIEEMRNLPKSFIAALSQNYTVSALSIITKLTEKTTDTTKFLLETFDGLLIECVGLIYDDGLTVCVSTQAGCKMHCSFCVSGKDGFYRNLTYPEMFSQVLTAQRITQKPLGNVVLMGSGEGLDNYDETIAFIKYLTDELKISPRRITLSTCGITPKIYELIKDNITVNLSISLHCALSRIRQEMMPIEKAYPIAEAIKAAHEYRKKSKRRLTLEYCLIEGLNDTEECIKALKALTKGSDDLVNIINVNEGSGVYSKNSLTAADRFHERLKKEQIDATIRRRLGSGINAACGQLRSGYIEKSKNNGDE